MRQSRCLQGATGCVPGVVLTAPCGGPAVFAAVGCGTVVLFDVLVSAPVFRVGGVVAEVAGLGQSVAIVVVWVRVIGDPGGAALVELAASLLSVFLPLSWSSGVGTGAHSVEWTVAW